MAMATTKQADVPPDVPKAVVEFVYLIESEMEKPSTRRNAEVIKAARNGLLALLGATQISKAKAYLERKGQPYYDLSRGAWVLPKPAATPSPTSEATKGGE